MKYSILLSGIILLLFALTGFALGISVQDSIPAGTEWSFSIDYSLASNSEIKVFLDDTQLVSLFERNGQIYANESEKSVLVSKYNYTKTQLVVFVAGQELSSKTIRADVYSAGVITETDSKNVSFFQPMSYSDRDFLYNRINSLESKAAQQSVTISDQDKIISDLNAQLVSKQNQINSLRENNYSLTDTLQKVNNEVELLKTSDENKSQQLTQISEDVKLALDNSASNPLSGFFVFDQNTIILPFILIAVLGLVVLVLVRYNKRKEHLYN